MKNNTSQSYTLTFEPGLGWAIEWGGDELVAQDVTLGGALSLILRDNVRRGREVRSADFHACSSSNVVARFQHCIDSGQVHFTPGDIFRVCRG